MHTVAILEEMISRGEIEADQLPMNWNKNEGRAKRALSYAKQHLLRSPEQAAWQQYKRLSTQIDSLDKLLADDGECSASDLCDLFTYEKMTDETTQKIISKIEELQKEKEQIYTLAKKYADFIRDENFY